MRISPLPPAIVVSFYEHCQCLSLIFDPVGPRTHLADLKSLTEDVLYETYRTEKLSRSVHSDIRDSQILPEELANQSVRLKEEQLRREEEMVSSPSSFLPSRQSESLICLRVASRGRTEGTERD